MANIEKLQSLLNEALANETEESLNEWLKLINHKPMSEKKKFFITAKDTFGSASFEIEADGFEFSISSGRLEVFNWIEADGVKWQEIIASFTSDHSICTVKPERVI